MAVVGVTPTETAAGRHLLSRRDASVPLRDVAVERWRPRRLNVQASRLRVVEHGWFAAASTLETVVTALPL